MLVPPGGKIFQILSKKLNVVLNDKNKNRIQTLKTNYETTEIKCSNFK